MSNIPENWIKDQERLWALADQDNCDGDCDLKPPYKQCPECLARDIINECGDIFRDALREIDSPKPTFMGIELPVRNELEN